MLRPLFSLNRANIFTQVEKHTEHFVNCIPTNEFIDLQPLFFRFTFDTTTFLLFGKSMNSLQSKFGQGAEKSREAKFFETFRISQDFLFRRGRIGGLYWLIGGKEFRQNNAIVHQFVDESIQEALSVDYQDGKVADVHCFLDALVQETRDPKVVRDQLLNVLLAGRDTTACCLTWTLYVYGSLSPRRYLHTNSFQPTAGTASTSSCKASRRDKFFRWCWQGVKSARQKHTEENEILEHGHQRRYIDPIIPTWPLCKLAQWFDEHVLMVVVFQSFGCTLRCQSIHVPH
jgi:hypothetical protein